MPALALEIEHGKSKLRAFASSRFAIGALVLIVLIIVAGKVLIAWFDGAHRDDARRQDHRGSPACSRPGRWRTYDSGSGVRDVERTSRSVCTSASEISEGTPVLKCRQRTALRSPWRQTSSRSCRVRPSRDTFA
jgi:hypothetical protein